MADSGLLEPLLSSMETTHNVTIVHETQVSGEDMHNV